MQSSVAVAFGQSHQGLWWGDAMPLPWHVRRDDWTLCGKLCCWGIESEKKMLWIKEHQALEDIGHKAAADVGKSAQSCRDKWDSCHLLHGAGELGMVQLWDGEG